jgi:uncharacterized BrkB/YihY/UPF0761 family membrane protein
VDGARKSAERGTERARGLPGASIAILSFEREQRSGAPLLAGGLAYRLFFWLVSFGLVLAAGASFWVRESQGSLEDAAKTFGLSGVAARSAATAVEEGSSARWYLLVSGLVLLLYFGVGAVRALRVTAFIAWQLAPVRMRHVPRASVTFTAFFIAGIGITMFASWVRENAPVIGVLATCGAIVVFLALGVQMFMLLPHPEEAGWRAMLPGAALMAVGITGIHVFTVYYLAAKLERSPKLYGTLGAATVVLLGLFLVGRVFVSGMFLNATAHMRGSPQRDEETVDAPVDALRS